jgi:hypothetical protein
MRGGRPERAKTYGKKREHGPDSGDSGLTRGGYVLRPAQGGGLLRAIISLRASRNGRNVAARPAYCTQQTRGPTRGITLRPIQQAEPISRGLQWPNRRGPRQSQVRP